MIFGSPLPSSTKKKKNTSKFFWQNFLGPRAWICYLFACREILHVHYQLCLLRVFKLVLLKNRSGIRSVSNSLDPDHARHFSTVLSCDQTVFKSRVKAGKFGHQVNSDTHLQTVEIKMRRLLMRRLIRIFTVCLGNIFFIWDKKRGCPNLAVCPIILDFPLITSRHQ